jgi:hypothetical protein
MDNVMTMAELNEWMGHCVAFAHLMNKAATEQIPMSLIDYDNRTGRVVGYGEVQYGRA